MLFLTHLLFRVWCTNVCHVFLKHLLTTAVCIKYTLHIKWEIVGFRHTYMYVYEHIMHVSHRMYTANVHLNSKCLFTLECIQIWKHSVVVGGC